MKRFPAIVRAISPSNVLRRWFVGVIHAVIVHTAGNVGAEEPTWRLEYRRSKDAPSNCPAEDYLHTALAAKNGARNPFSNDAPRTIVINIVPTTERIEGRIQVRDEGGNVVSESIAHAPSWRCDQLADRIVFVLRDIVDPLLLTDPAASPTPPNSPVSSPQQPPNEQPPKEKTRASGNTPVSDRTKRKPAISRQAKPSLALSLGLGATWWNAPSTAFTSVLGIGARWPRFLVGFEARYDRAYGLPIDQLYSAEQAGAALVVCGYYSFLHTSFFTRGCILGDMARMWIATDGAKAMDYSSTLINLGARVGAGVSLSRVWSIELNADGVFAVHQPLLVLNAEETWHVPTVNGALRANLVGLFDVF